MKFLYMTGLDNFDIDIDNHVNNNLFIGRIIHMPLELFKFHRSSRCDQLIEHLNSISKTAFNECDPESSVFAFNEVYKTWLNEELLIIGRKVNNNWLLEAKGVLTHFVACSYFSRDSELAIVNSRQWLTDLIKFLKWLDNAPVFGSVYFRY